MYTPTHMSSTCCAVLLSLSSFNNRSATILSHCLHTTQGDPKNTRDVSFCKTHDDRRMNSPHRAHARTFSVGVATMPPRSVNLSARALCWANASHRVFKTWTCYTSHDILRHSLKRRGKKTAYGFALCMHADTAWAHTFLTCCLSARTSPWMASFFIHTPILAELAGLKRRTNKFKVGVGKIKLTVTLTSKLTVALNICFAALKISRWNRTTSAHPYRRRICKICVAPPTSSTLNAKC